MKTEKFWIAVILAGGLVVASFIGGFYIYKSKTPIKTVSVVGLAEKDFVSDLIVWNMYFTSKNKDMKLAFADIKEKGTQVKKYLVAKGVSEKEIVFEAITNYESTRTEWIGEKYISVFDGYVLTQQVRVESKEVEKIEKISREITELIDKGIDLNSASPEYYYTKLSDLKITMLGEASKDAYNRAKTIADNSGGALGELKTANMGVFQITAPNSAEDTYTWGGAFNTSSKNKRASINMRLTYFVK